ncbi:rab effector Noc2 isoform X4 [Tursiops truncatus]|uniref:rab effector Noc2 isoform X4 n=1 Tax=Tursiops truncatus TaxID=9739 RepID=UPI003CCEF9B7
MADTIFGSGNDQWVCPNDRQLALRAKLQTGWSVHTYQTEKQRKSQCLSPAEVEAILQVIQRAERLDVLEQQRVGRLVERLETMRRNVMGNGLSQCLLCGEVLGFLGSSSVFCKDCRKWFPATVTVTQISAPPVWRTDSHPLGSGTGKAADPGGNQVAAWSHQRWGLPAHPATSQGASAAWPSRRDRLCRPTVGGPPRPDPKGHSSYYRMCSSQTREKTRTQEHRKLRIQQRRGAKTVPRMLAVAVCVG